MNKWTVGDIYDIIREGVPFANMNTLRVNTWSMPGMVSNSTSSPPTPESHVNITLLVEFPLEKIRDISIFGGDLNELFKVIFHPELMKNGNSIYCTGTPASYNTQLFTVENGKVVMEVAISMKEDNVGQTARSIRDSNFYSLLDAALAD